MVDGLRVGSLHDLRFKKVERAHDGMVDVGKLLCNLDALLAARHDGTDHVQHGRVSLVLQYLARSPCTLESALTGGLAQRSVKIICSQTCTLRRFSDFADSTFDPFIYSGTATGGSRDLAWVWM